MWLDLSDGAQIKLTDGHNIQGAQQPGMMHIGVKAKGVGHVVCRHVPSCSFVLSIEGVSMKLGIWWLEAAARGGPAVLPVVNQKPIFEDSPAASSIAQAVKQATASVGCKTGSKTAITSSQVKSKSSK